MWQIFFYENDESGVGCCNGARAYYNVKRNIIGPTALHIYYTLRRSGGQILRQWSGTCHGDVFYSPPSPPNESFVT